MKIHRFTSFLLYDSFNTSSSIWGLMETVKKFEKSWLPFQQKTLLDRGLLQCETHLHNLQDPIHLKKVVWWSGRRKIPGGWCSVRWEWNWAFPWWSVFWSGVGWTDGSEQTPGCCWSLVRPGSLQDIAASSGFWKKCKTKNKRKNPENEWGKSNIQKSG